MTRPLLYPLRWHLGALAFCLLCSGVMLQQAWQHYRKAEAQAQRAAQQARTAANAVRQLEGDEARIRAHIEYFRKLKAQGVFAADNPSQRAGLLRHLRRDLRIASIDSEFSEPTPLALGEFAAKTGGFSFQARQLRLRMALLHEEDLIRALDLLNQRAPALLRLRECRMERAHEAASAAGRLLLADCRLEWITLSKNREA